MKYIINKLPTQEKIETAATQDAMDYWGHRDRDSERGFEHGVKWLMGQLKTQEELDSEKKCQDVDFKKNPSLCELWPKSCKGCILFYAKKDEV